MGEVNNIEKNENISDVIILTRTKKRPQFLKRAFDSVLGQTYKEWQHTVLHDGVLEKNLIDHYKKQYDGRFVAQETKNENPEEMLNKAIKDATQKYVAIHDDDDFWAPDFLQIALSAFSQESKNIAVCGVVTHYHKVSEHNEGNSIYEDELTEVVIPGTVVNLDNLLYTCPYKPICFVFERKTALDVGLFNTSLSTASFWDFMIRMALNKDILVVPRFLAYYHIRESAIGNVQNRSLSDPDEQQKYEQIVKNAYLRGMIKKEANTAK